MRLLTLTALISATLFAPLTLADNFTVEVRVDATKNNGKSWDAFGGSPDIMLSVDGMTHPTQMCRDAYRCEFTFSSNHRDWYLEIYDKDISQHDLIGKGECASSPCQLGQAKLVIHGPPNQLEKALKDIGDTLRKQL